MTVTTATRAGQAELEAARLLLERMGVTPEQLLQVVTPRPPAPTFADYLPVVEAAVGAGTRRVYGSYWNRVRDRWGDRRIDEPTPSQIKQLCEDVRANVVLRRNARGGHKAAEHLIAALRCMYTHAIWTRDDPRWAVTVVDTTGRTTEESSAQLQRWVTAVRADVAAGRLSLLRGWASR